MYVEKIELQDFRAFKEETSINLGVGITCIAGLNGTGKSTILAALGNCGALKAKEGKHLNNTRFQAAYSDLIRKDEGDTSGYKARLFFQPHEKNEELPIKNLRFRAISQNERYRLIPMKKDQGHERKLPWPTYYLGLSRLYPIGEADHTKTISISLTASEKEDYITTYKKIMSSQDDLLASSVIKLTDARKKIGAAISTKDYGYMANSAGQDNLGQILLTVLSFKRLKNKLGENYHGGLLLIDELDATLHPAAQNKLYNYLKDQSKRYNLQIVFTTHSLSLLEHVHEISNLSDNNKFIRLLYLTRERGKVEVKTNPSIKSIRAGLRVSMAEVGGSVKIPMLTEDSVAAEFAQWLISEFYENIYLQIPETSLSFEQMAKLIKSYPDFFFDSLIIFDADVRKDENKSIVGKRLKDTYFVDQIPRLGDDKYRRYFFLPGDEPIETMMWNFISHLPENDDFYFEGKLEELNLTKQTLIIEYEEKFSEDKKGDFKRLELHKDWFNNPTVKLIRHQIYTRWLQDNEEKLKLKYWVDDLMEEYKKIGKRISILFDEPRVRG